MFADNFDVLAQRGVASREFPVSHAVDIGDGFEALDVADDFARLNRGSGFFFPLVTSTISPSMRVANFVKPTRQRSPSSRSSQKCDGL